MNNNKKEEINTEKVKKLATNEKYLEELSLKMKDIFKDTKDMKPGKFIIYRDPEIFKNNSLPLARIKKIMKSDECVKMIAGEAPILFSKACELFIIELAYRSWIHTVESNRRTLQRSDIATAIAQTDFFDFLLDIVEESCKKKLQMYANYQMSSGPEPNSLNNILNINDNPYPDFRINNNEIFPQNQSNYMQNNNLNLTGYQGNMMLMPNSSLNQRNYQQVKCENEKNNESNGNNINLNSITYIKNEGDYQHHQKQYNINQK